MKAPSYTLAEFRNGFGSDRAGIRPVDIAMDAMENAARTIELCTHELDRNPDAGLVCEVLRDVLLRLLEAATVADKEAKAVQAEIEELRAQAAAITAPAAASTRRKGDHGSGAEAATTRRKARANASKEVITGAEPNAAGGAS